VGVETPVGTLTLPLSGQPSSFPLWLPLVVVGGLLMLVTVLRPARLFKTPR
jgi:hypothetical protein